MTTEIMGYKVEKVNASKNIGYKFYGKRNAVYTLIRMPNDSNYMFVTNKNGYVCSIQGNYTWTDKDGNLRPAYGFVS